MNERVIVAQATSGTAAAQNDLKIVEVLKPQNGQALTLELGYTQKVKLDLSKIANEKLTFVHVGEKLVILFDNQSTVTVEPFFDSSRNILGNLSIEVGAGRIINGQEFAAAFPISDDQSVLPAAGNAQGGNAQAGANFHDPSVDALGGSSRLALLGQEELGTFVTEQRQTQLVQNSTGGGSGSGGTSTDLIPTVSGTVFGVVEEEQLNPQNVIQPSDTGTGNEDQNDVSNFDDDTSGDSTVTSQTFSGTLAGLVSGGDPPITFQANNAINGANVTDGNGTTVTSLGADVTFLYIDSTTVQGVAGARLVFILTVNPDGTFTFKLNDQIDHPTKSVDDGSNPQGIFEETLNLDLSGAVIANDATPTPVTFPDGTFMLGVIDDTPTAADTIPGTYDGDFYAFDPVDDEGATSNTGFTGNSGGNGDVFGEDNTTSGYLNFAAGADNLKNLDFASLDNTAAAFKAIYDNGGVSGQETVTYYWDGLTHTLTAVGDTSGDTVFTLTIDNLSNGHFTFSLDSALVHSDIDETANLAIVLPFTVTDGDGDQAIANLTIEVNDDTPTISSITLPRSGIAALDEGDTDAGSPASSSTATITNYSGYTIGDDPNVTGTGAIASAVTASAIVSVTAAFGADGAAASGDTTYALTVTDSDSGLAVTDGASINLVDVNGDGSIILGVVDAGSVSAFAGQVAFAIEIDASTGIVTVEQYLSLEHPDQASAGNGYDSYDEPVNLAAESLGVVVTVTDGDGDTAVSDPIDVSDQISFEDDGPKAADEITQTLTESHIVSTDWLSGTVSNTSANDNDVKVTTINGLVNGNTLKIDWTAPNGGTLYWELRDPNNGGAVVASGSASSNGTSLSQVLSGLTGTGIYDLYVDYQKNGASTTLTVTDVHVESSVTSTASGNVTDNDAFGSDGGYVSSVTYIINANGDTLTETITNDGNASTGVTVDSFYGLLTINEFGTYSYQVDLNAVATSGGSETDHFSYTITDGDGDQANASMDFEINDVQGPSILDVMMITNSNNVVQPVIMTFADQASPEYSYARLFALNGQGQQGTFTPDTGFDINATHKYAVALEAASGDKALLTDLSIENVPIYGQATGGGGGTIGLELDNTISTSSDQTALTAVVQPNLANPTQANTTSTDGDENSNLPIDAGTSTFNYYYGADGVDTLTGSTDADLLNGGNGADSVSGNGGNDILVYDVADLLLDGGSGSDVLRIDQGALALFNGSATTHDNATGFDVIGVDLTGNTAIHNMEVLLITDDAFSDPSQGTKLSLTAQDVFNFTDSNHTLFVDGNAGDILAIGSGWTSAGDIGGFAAYTATISNVQVMLKVEHDVVVQTA